MIRWKRDTRHPIEDFQVSLRQCSPTQRPFTCACRSGIRGYRTLGPNDVFTTGVLVLYYLPVIRDQIPKRKYPTHADCFSTIKEARDVLSEMRIKYVKSHQKTSKDDKRRFEFLPFTAAQLNVLCDRMATEQLLRFPTGEWAPQSIHRS